MSLSKEMRCRWWRDRYEVVLKFVHEARKASYRIPAKNRRDLGPGVLVADSVLALTAPDFGTMNSHRVAPSHRWHWN